MVDLSDYAENNISGYMSETSIPEENLNYLNSGLTPYTMNNMFGDMWDLVSIPKLEIDTSYCLNMGRMFYHCKLLSSLDLSNFDTSNVTSMNGMFSYCELLRSLDLSNFNTSKVTDMNDMFEYCQSLTDLDISSFDTSKVTNFENFLARSTYIKSIKGVIDMKSCTNYSFMFDWCSKLTGVQIKNPPSDFPGDNGLKEGQYVIVS